MFFLDTDERWRKDLKKSTYLEKHKENAKIVLRVTVVGILANVLLVVLKTIFGVLYGNLSVVSDAVHSATDLITSLFIVVAVFISSPKSDKSHNYGHEKREPLMVMFFSLVLAGVGGLLVWQGISGIISPVSPSVNYYLIGVIVVSLVVKEALFLYGLYYAKKTKSELLKADAWHSRSDSLSSLAVLIGLVCSLFMQTNLVESIAILVVALMIFKVAFDIFRPAVNQLTDKSADEKTCNTIREVAISVEGVSAVETLRTRMFGNMIYVDITIEVDGALDVNNAHVISRAVHDNLEAIENLRIKHCNVAVVPNKVKKDNERTCDKASSEESSVGID